MVNKREYTTAEAVRDTLISPNECDSNGESANVVDALFAIARSIRRLAEATEKLQSSVEDISMSILHTGGPKD